MYISLADIIVSERIREDKKGTETEWREFLGSFRRLGQLMPIRVSPLPDGKYQLIAGERRLLAIQELNASEEAILHLSPGFIEAVLAESTDSRVQLLMEFDENMKRKDFNFVEKARFIRKFHEQMLAETNGKWEQVMTAHALTLSKASISQYLQVEQAVKNNTEVAKASTLKAAVKRMKNQEEHDRRHVLAKQGDNNALQRAEGVLKHGDARSLIKDIADESVDFINFDPPWGDDVAHKSQENHPEFDDSLEYANLLMGDIFPDLFRILRPNRFCLFWHRSWASETFGKYAETFGFSHGPSRTPAIWYKPDKITDQNRQPEKQLIEAYETFFILRKGEPIFYEKMANNVFAFDRVTRGGVIHPTEKPIELCRSLVSLCTVPGELVFDPTAGSSSMPEAALRSNRKALAFEQSDVYYTRGITRLAEYLKTFSETQ